ncbi:MULTISPECIES: MarR family winged helix-turn-helix transcriptional regulator [unclassified Streptomyces]|uniref:MarR family winged helix-turn-helix transcriptional regulator n=1 Tax=unclassified Streptomyces TaxID=2593676 RepID=UPI00225A5BB0|nr:MULTISPECIES: MarR family winged helix-turn-helix transcriptional regulator [unclassified Streptomyces]MCX5144015.1 MarR family winged helix-turn-helix transcriptional regulator [Streptomyces sp. NBC_00338]WRZ68401.1 MarR family winged helix-turn-helix transcriptional regulator [Streptomyces sp. NBC_01257]WSU62359.1 MarR family winged helix-turn-helix transcriptional regulator [Streptomyces sp. NBC_01104]
MTTEPTPAGLADDQPLDTVDALVQLSFLVQRVLTAVGGEHDLSVIQIRLLGILRDRQAGMLELGGHLGLDKSSMTGLVARAEKRGLVRRSPSPHDGRAVLVSLTPLGAELTAGAADEIGRRVTALTAHLPPGEREVLTRLAGTLVSGSAHRSRGVTSPDS